MDSGLAALRRPGMTATESTRSDMALALERPVGDRVHLDLGVDDGACFHRRTGQNRVLEVLGEHLVVAAEVAGILEIGGHPHDVGQRRAFFRKNAFDGLDRAGGLLLDRAVQHVVSASLATWPETKMK